VQHAVETKLTEVTAAFHSDLESVRLQLSTELSHLSDSVDRVFQAGSSAPAAPPAAAMLVRDPVDGPAGHRCSLGRPSRAPGGGLCSWHTSSGQRYEF
jgi:hypothetical protein